MSKLNQFNTDGSDSDDGFFGWVQCMVFAAVQIVAVVFVLSAVVGFVCGLRSLGWI